MTAPIRNAAGGTGAALAGYLAGTAIATPDGAAPVETLRPGDRVAAAGGGSRAVRWVGRVTVDPDRHPAPHRAAPIRLRAGAVADGLPHRDLLLSPGHGVLADGHLVPAQLLLNGATVLREPGAGSVSYWHVELDRPGLLLAEGVAAESYLDTGDRDTGDRDTGDRDIGDRGGFDPRGGHAAACAPLVLDGPALAAVRAKLLARAAALGWRRSAVPGLRVLANARPLVLELAETGRWTAYLPAGATALRLLSRSFVPSAQAPDAADTRRLGLAVTAVRRDGAAVPEPCYQDGWHAPEPAWRWTDGDAHLRLAPRRHGGLLEIVTQPDAAPGYWQAPDVPASEAKTR